MCSWWVALRGLGDYRYPNDHRVKMVSVKVARPIGFCGSLIDGLSTLNAGS
jgi:hypothetical protein